MVPQEIKFRNQTKNKLSTALFGKNFVFFEENFVFFIGTTLENRFLFAKKYLSIFSLCFRSDDNSIKIWNLIDSSLMKTLTGHSRGVVCLEQFTNGYLISGANDNSIKGIFKSFLKIKPISRDLFVNKDLSTISNEINTLSH